MMLCTKLTASSAGSVWSYVAGSYRELSQIAGRLERMFSLTSRVNRVVIPVHRFCGLAFLLQLAASFVLYMIDLRLFLATPLWFTLPMCGTVQAISAAYYFRHTTPKKADPGFMSMGDVGRISWFFVCENIFYSFLLWFQNCYYHPTLFGLPEASEGVYLAEEAAGSIRAGVLTVVEVMFVFLPYFWRPLFPKTALRDAQKNKTKNRSASNIDFYTKNTYVVKAFYNFAKHFIGFFLNYCRFLGRVPMFGPGHSTIYGLEILSAYMATGQLFIHTLVFKNLLTNKQGAMLYQVGYPFTIYLYYRMGTTVIWRNLDLALLSAVGMALNFLPDLSYFHTYQAFLACLFYLWRRSFLDRPSNDFSLESAGTFLGDLRSWAAAHPVLASLALAFVLLGHRLPVMARRNNPFYMWGERFKRERPHPEDDPCEGAKVE